MEYIAKLSNSFAKLTNSIFRNLFNIIVTPLESFQVYEWLFPKLKKAGRLWRRFIKSFELTKRFPTCLKFPAFQRALENIIQFLLCFNFGFLFYTFAATFLSGSKGGCKIELLQAKKLLKNPLEPIYNSIYTLRRMSLSLSTNVIAERSECSSSGMTAAIPSF